MIFRCSAAALILVALTVFHLEESALAQSIPPQVPESIPAPRLPFQENQPPSLQPQPIPQPQPLPNPSELLQPSQPAPTAPQPVPGEVPQTVRVDRFNVMGSTVFSPEQLAAVTRPFTNRDLTFTQLLEARSAVLTAT